MKKILVISFCASLSIFKANAQIQRQTNPSQNVATNSDKKADKMEMMEGLNLTKQQMAELKEFHRSQKQKKDNIMNDQSLSEEQKQSKLKDLHKEQKEKLNSILTPEQMEKLKEERKNMKMQNGSMNNIQDSTKHN